MIFRKLIAIKADIEKKIKSTVITAPSNTVNTNTLAAKTNLSTEPPASPANPKNTDKMKLNPQLILKDIIAASINNDSNSGIIDKHMNDIKDVIEDMKNNVLEATGIFDDTKKAIYNPLLKDATEFMKGIENLILLRSMKMPRVSDYNEKKLKKDAEKLKKENDSRNKILTSNMNKINTLIDNVNKNKATVKTAIEIMKLAPSCNKEGSEDKKNIEDFNKTLEIITIIVQDLIKNKTELEVCKLLDIDKKIADITNFDPLK
ncbi:MAG: hypothetical protein GY730_04490 [bacterium]|nr:hypothetical protein [bacterium]